MNRQQVSQLYRPNGAKPVRTGVAWSSGGSFQLNNAIDLSLPIKGLRMIFSGRLVIGTAAFTSVNPEGFLNLISNIRVSGTNARQKGNVTLYDIDLATLWTMQHLFERSAAYFSIAAGGSETHVPVPTTPFPASGANGYINGATGTYDFRIAVDLPFYPFNAPEGVRAAYQVRQEDWKDSLQLSLTFGAQAGNSTGALGVAAATTTVTFTSYGSGSGSPTIDIYALPISMGLDLKDLVAPGVLTRVQKPISSVLQSNGTNVNLADLENQKTTRVFAKIGTGTVAPHFATLSDSIVTALGITLGGNRAVRDRVSIYAHKMSQQTEYSREPIQGYNVLDFIESGNPDSAYPGDRVGGGSTFQLVGDVTGTANAYGIIVQEQILHAPDGALYNF